MHEWWFFVLCFVVGTLKWEANGGNLRESSTAGFLHFRNQRQGVMKRFLWYALCVLCLLGSFYGMYGNSVLYKCRDLICLFLTKWPSTMIRERNTKAMAWLLKYCVIEKLQDIFDVCTAAPQNGVQILLLIFAHCSHFAVICIVYGFWFFFSFSLSYTDIVLVITCLFTFLINMQVYSSKTRLLCLKCC